MFYQKGHPRDKNAKKNTHTKHQPEHHADGKGHRKELDRQLPGAELLLVVVVLLEDGQVDEEEGPHRGGEGDDHGAGLCILCFQPRRNKKKKEGDITLTKENTCRGEEKPVSLARASLSLSENWGLTVGGLVLFTSCVFACMCFLLCVCARRMCMRMHACLDVVSRSWLPFPLLC